jgi:hypothetical protein
MHAPAMPAVKSTEQDLAQDQKANRLPEMDRVQTEDNRHEPIPEAHHYKSKDTDEQNRKQRHFYYLHNSITFHFSDLILTDLVFTALMPS